jgi:hypothetical protein
MNTQEKRICFEVDSGSENVTSISSFVCGDINFDDSAVLYASRTMQILTPLLDSTLRKDPDESENDSHYKFNGGLLCEISCQINLAINKNFNRSKNYSLLCIF